MRTRLWIAALIFPVVNSVLFGLGVIPLLSIESLSDQVRALFPFVVASSFVLAVPISWMLAPRLRLRYWRNSNERQGRAS